MGILRSATHSLSVKVEIPKPDRATVALLDEALGDRHELRRGQMFGCPGFFLGTKAVAVLFGDDVTVTLPQARVEELIEERGYRPFVAARGRAMRGWALVSQEQLSELGPDASLWDEAIAHVKEKAKVGTKLPAKKKAGKQ